MVEAMLGDLAASDPDWRIVALRYFNPVGAHESGLIGEDPEGPPDNLLLYVVQTAVGRHPHVRVFGTGVRDYIDFSDLASGHLRALVGLAPGFASVNLGRGAGAGVIEVILAVGGASGQPVPWRLQPRRPGDVAELVADRSLSLRQLG
jgi:UDP-glucose 4-epimerase